MTPRTRPAPPRPRAKQPAALADLARACGLGGPMRVVVRDEDGRPAGEHLLHGPFAFVGRGRRADVPLEAPEVSPQHAFLLAVGGRVFVLDLGSRTGVRWSDGPQSSGWLEPGDEVKVGPYTLRVQLDTEDGEAPPAGPELTSLELLNEPAATRIRPLTDVVTLVGRASACAFRGYGPKLAAHHCALVNAGGCLWVVDLRSGRGTRVNGRPVRAARLRDGDLIEAGEWSAVPQPATVASEALVAAPTDPAAQAFAPFGQMMDQFQQCVMMMGQMFRAMQQEHLSLVRDQVVQLRDVARAMLDRQMDETAAAPFADSIPEALPAPPDEPPLAPSLPDPAHTQALLQAHAWFNQRLAHLNSAGTL